MDEITKFIDLISSVEFWTELIEGFRFLGPIAPIFLTMIEAFVPVLPLVAIVAFNVVSYGVFLGFLYSWIGALIGSVIVFSVVRALSKTVVIHKLIRGERIQKLLNWVANQSVVTLFILASLPVTPSSLLNVSFGLSSFSTKKFIMTIALAKSIMILLLSIFGEAVVKSFENPLYIIIVLGLIALSMYAKKLVDKKSNINKL